MGFVEWHKAQIKGWQNSYGLTDYQMLWLSWGKGVLFAIIVLLLGYIIWRFLYNKDCNNKKINECEEC